MTLDIDDTIRLKTFQWLKEQVAIHGDVLPRAMLQQGFMFEGERIPLIAPQGIFKPRYLDLPLSITTAPNGPYMDRRSSDGFLLYKYRGNDPNHRDNMGLRQAMIQGKPLVYFEGVVPGRYLATWPVYLVEDNPRSLTFKVAVDDAESVMNAAENRISDAVTGRRAYITAIVRQRLHQRGFRERVLHAYRQQCSLCKLKHYELLDAAHIIPDQDPEGLPVIQNGIALCKLHHAAFDGLILGITPDYTIDIRPDILDESDGPVLQHGLKELHGERIIIPRQKQHWPDRDKLYVRYQQFKRVS